MIKYLMEKLSKTESVQKARHEVLSINYMYDNKNKAEFALGLYNLMWGNSILHMLPQYKYIARPVYNFFGGKNNPLVAVPASFVVTDLIMHQLIPILIDCFIKSDFSFDLISKLNLPLTIAWFALSLPVAYYKHLQTVVIDDKFVTFQELSLEDKRKYLLDTHLTAMRDELLKQFAQYGFEEYPNELALGSKKFA
ncbi:hypothetical protein [Legionella beliardensis]|nr:hypothetical protein [Legionella beliardensis]